MTLPNGTGGASCLNEKAPVKKKTRVKFYVSGKALILSRIHMANGTPILAYIPSHGHSGAKLKTSKYPKCKKKPELNWTVCL